MIYKRGEGKGKVRGKELVKGDLNEGTVRGYV